jgi:hypothetical protein
MAKIVRTADMNVIRKVSGSDAITGCAIILSKDQAVLSD